MAVQVAVVMVVFIIQLPPLEVEPPILEVAAVAVEVDKALLVLVAVQAVQA
jgi:hypothetical protein